jgi:single-strand DNA-binding protein
MNIIEVIGNLGSDPETRYTPSGQKVTTFRIASNSKKGGKDITIWFRITVWGDRFDKMMSYMKKGSFVMVVGELHKPEIFNNREGQPQIGLEVTAEMIKFVPGARPAGEKKEGQEGSYGQSEGNNFGGGYGGGFGESGGNQGKNHSFAEEEEEVPF